MASSSTGTLPFEDTMSSHCHRHTFARDYDDSSTARPECLSEKYYWFSEVLLCVVTTAGKGLRSLYLCLTIFRFFQTGYNCILPLWWPLASRALMFFNNGEGGGEAQLCSLLLSSYFLISCIPISAFFCCPLLFSIHSPTLSSSPPSPLGEVVLPGCN